MKKIGATESFVSRLNAKIIDKVSRLYSKLDAILSSLSKTNKSVPIVAEKKLNLINSFL